MRLLRLGRQTGLHTGGEQAKRAVNESLIRSAEVQRLVRELRQRRIVNGFAESLAVAYRRSLLTHHQ
jgi:hypothetical protein